MMQTRNLRARVRAREKTVNQGTALARGTLALPPLVIEGLAEFKGSFERLCLQAGTAAIETMLAADAEQLCGKRVLSWSRRIFLRFFLDARMESFLRGHDPDLPV